MQDNPEVNNFVGNKLNLEQDANNLSHLHSYEGSSDQVRDFIARIQALRAQATALFNHYSILIYGDNVNLCYSRFFFKVAQILNGVEDTFQNFAEFPLILNSAFAEIFKKLVEFDQELPNLALSTNPFD